MSAHDPIVFVVDDDRSFLTAIARLLRAAGHVVETFPSGADLLARLSGGAAGCVSHSASISSPARVRASERSSNREPRPKMSRSFA